MTRIIGITGAAGSGKTTLAEILVHDHGFTTYSYAAPLKDMLLTLNPEVCYPEVAPNTGTDRTAHLCSQIMRLQGWVEAIGYERAKREIPEVRRLLQVLGTDCIRAADEDFWVRLMSNRWDNDYAALGPWDRAKIVLPDIRFDNEAEHVWGEGGRIVRLYGRGDESVPDHVSEDGIDSEWVTDEFDNSGTLDALREYAAELARG